MRIVLLGNAGAGKSTMARRLIGDQPIPRLSLDEIAWHNGPKRRPMDESLQVLGQFLTSNDRWVIEGCYGDLVEAALSHCTELRFLNPGVETCVAHCKRRPWEPSKFSTTDEQDKMLGTLLAWVRDYETRNDEYGLKRHRRIYEQFTGPKREYKTVASYTEG
jgi:adenylate kinase family enzyme